MNCLQRFAKIRLMLSGCNLTIQKRTRFTILSYFIGCTVISTIHQPSSETFELFDRMLLLALGKVVYHGTSEKAMEFYDRYIPRLLKSI